MTAEPRVTLCAAGEIWGGVERFVETLSRYLDARGVGVRVAVLYDGALRQRLEESGIPVSLVAGRGRYDPACIPRLTQVLRAHNANILHTHGYRATVIGSIAARFAGVKHIRTEHGRVEPWQGATRWRMEVNATLERLASRWLTDAVVFVSRDIQQRSRGASLTTFQRVIYNGIAPTAGSQTGAGSTFEGGPAAFHVGIVGRVAAVKGHLCLLRALERLPHLPNLHVHILGTGPLEAECRAVTAGAGLSNRVHFLGFVSNIDDYMRRLNLLVIPSLHEGLPYTLLEGMYHSVPIIASNVGGLAEVLENERTGILVPPGDVGQLARAIERVYRDQTLRQRLSSEAHARVCQRFLVEAMAGQYLDVYERVLSN